MGYWSRQTYQSQQYGYFQCSPGCEASDSSVRYCLCRCRGVNHGRLLYHREQRPIHVSPESESFPVIDERVIPMLPNKTLELTAQTLARELDHNRGLENPAKARASPLSQSPKKSKAKGFLKKITGIRSQDDLNEAVLKGLRYQFNAERVEAIVDQAFTFRQSERPQETRPELYELYETGEIDRATEYFGSRWVIGRPKIR
jgi:hypothetical protein